MWHLSCDWLFRDATFIGFLQVHFLPLPWAEPFLACLSFPEGDPFHFCRKPSPVGNPRVLFLPPALKAGVAAPIQILLLLLIPSSMDVDFLHLLDLHGKT